jgi:hypothetical protein
MSSNMKSVLVSHDGRDVTFSSADDAEIGAVKDCYEYFWAVGDAPGSSRGWSVTSLEVSSIQDVVDTSALTSRGGLFKYDSLPHVTIGGLHYYRHDIQGIDCLTRFDPGNNATIFYHAGKVEAYSYIRNLVREPLLEKYLGSGNVAMHASACAIGGKGILMPGAKGAGKSTLMTHLLAGGAKFVGNDAVFCKNDQGSITLAAIPQGVRLSKETIGNSEKLSSYLVEGENCDFIDGKLEFPPRLFDSIFSHHKLAPVSPLTMIVIPSLDLSRTDYSLAIGHDELDLQILEDSLFGKYHSYTWSPFFDYLNDPYIEVSNFTAVFKSLPRICHLQYGILGDEAKAQLFNDVSEAVN